MKTRMGIFPISAGAVDANEQLCRSFRLGQRMQLQFRAEAFTLTNAPHLINPGTHVSNLRLNENGTVRSPGGFMAVSDAAADDPHVRSGLRL
jgi:hypothetical protein